MKTKYKEASEDIRRAIDSIREYAEPDYFDFNVTSAQENILAYMHDNKLNELRLHIAYKSLEYYYYFGSEAHKISSLDSFVKAIKAIHTDVGLGNMSYNFVCSPEVLDNEFWELVDFTCAVDGLIRANESLLHHEELINNYDNSVLGDFKREIDSIARIAYDSLTKEHEIFFVLADTSQQIPSKILNNLVDWENIVLCAKVIKTDISARLYKVQQGIFSRI